MKGWTIALRVRNRDLLNFTLYFLANRIKSKNESVNTVGITTAIPMTFPLERSSLWEILFIVVPVPFVDESLVRECVRKNKMHSLAKDHE